MSRARVLCCFVAALFVAACQDGGSGRPAADVAAAADGSPVDVPPVARYAAGTPDGAAPLDVSPAPDTPGGGEDATAPPVDTAEPADVPAAPDAGAADVPPAPTDVCQPECPVGSVRCADAAAVQACEADESGCGRWGVVAACDAGEACSAGECVPACAAEDTRCLDGLVLQVCDGGQRREETCPYGCDAAGRRCWTCPDGAWRCVEGAGGVRLETCLAGDRWSLHDVCAVCACQATGPTVRMECRYARDPVPTDCTRCSADGLFCFP